MDAAIGAPVDESLHLVEGGIGPRVPRIRLTRRGDDAGAPTRDREDHGGAVAMQVGRDLVGRRCSRTVEAH
ncbi:hypothetical protein FHU13_002341 [Methylobacterium sp. R2-1]|nr:hypothetical protein [Methylobacterium sp. R2-1]